MKLVECSSSEQEFKEYLQLRMYQHSWLQAILDEIIIELESLRTLLGIAEETDQYHPEGIILDFLDRISFEAVESKKNYITLQEKQERYEQLRYYKIWIKYLLKQIKLDIRVVKKISAN
jgi:hypothetical protein